MRLPRLSRRLAFESTSLLLIGLALVAIAIQLLTGFSLDKDAIANSFWYVGLTFIAAVVLLPALNGGTVRSLNRMRLPTLSRREKIESASLLLAGLASIGVASPLLAMEGILSDTQFAVACCFWLCGFILIGAGVLCRFHCVFSGFLIGSIVLGYLSISKINSDGINANTTFLDLAEEMAATHPELDGHTDAASATPSPISPSD